MKNKFAGLALGLICLASNISTASWREGGGGDPLATEFIRIAQEIGSTLSNNVATSEMSRDNFQRALARVNSSLAGQGPIVVFPDGNTVICLGAPKLGCYTGDGKIHIAREGWETASLRDKIEVTAMEMSFLVKKDWSRYQFAPDIAATVLARGFTLDPVLTPEFVSANSAPSATGEALLINTRAVVRPAQNSTGMSAEKLSAEWTGKHVLIAARSILEFNPTCGGTTHLAGTEKAHEALAMGAFECSGKIYVVVGWLDLTYMVPARFVRLLPELVVGD